MVLLSEDRSTQFVREVIRRYSAGNVLETKGRELHLLLNHVGFVMEAVIDIHLVTDVTNLWNWIVRNIGSLYEDESIMTRRPVPSHEITSTYIHKSDDRCMITYYDGYDNSIPMFWICYLLNTAYNSYES